MKKLTGNEVLVDTGTARSLANQAGYSVAQYYRRFQRETGERPVEMRRRLRLERAAYELSQSPE